MNHHQLIRHGLLLVAAVGCSGRSSQQQRAAGSSSGSATIVGSAATDTGSGKDVESFGPAIPRVTLDKPGGEPRHVIAYAPHAAERTAKLSFMIGSEDTAGAGTGWTLVVSWRSPADVAHPYELTVKESRAEMPADAKDGERGIIGAVGAMYSSIKVRVDADASGRGRVIRTSDTLPTKPSIIWLVHPLIVPVPAEPVGVGATWRVTQALHMDALEGQLARTYELTAMQGDTFTVKVSGSTRWRDPAGPGSDADAETETITGTLVVKTSDLLPVSADVTSTEDLGVMKAATHLRLGP